MSDLISRPAVFGALHEYFYDGFDDDKFWNSTYVLSAIRDCPTIEERPRGRWKKSDDMHGHRCSLCHSPITFVKYDEHEAIKIFSRFCPWCGAELEDDEFTETEDESVNSDR